MAKAKPVPDGYHTLTPQLMLDNTGQTIDWYRRAFGVEEVSRFVGPDGKIMHAELKFGDSRFTVGEVMKDLPACVTNAARRIPAVLYAGSVV